MTWLHSFMMWFYILLFEKTNLREDKFHNIFILSYDTYQKFLYDNIKCNRFVWYFSVNTYIYVTLISRNIISSWWFNISKFKSWKYQYNNIFFQVLDIIPIKSVSHFQFQSWGRCPMRAILLYVIHLSKKGNHNHLPENIEKS